MTIIVKQFGFQNGSGLLSNLVDGDVLTGWAPLATGFAQYSFEFLNSLGAPNAGGQFPAIEFDMGVAVRIPVFLIKTETIATLGPAMLVASDNPATTVNDTVQASDVLMGLYTDDQMTNGLPLATAAAASAIIKRYYRLCQRIEP